MPVLYRGSAVPKGQCVRTTKYLAGDRNRKSFSFCYCSHMLFFESLSTFYFTGLFNLVVVPNKKEVCRIFPFVHINNTRPIKPNRNYYIRSVQ